MLKYPTKLLSYRLSPYLSVSPQYLEIHLLGTPSGHNWHDLRNISCQTTYSHHTTLRTRENYRNQGTKYLPNKVKTKYQHLELQYPQPQMCRHQPKYTFNNSQENKSPLEPSNSITGGPEKLNVVEVQAKGLKIAFVNSIEILKEEMNKYENTNK